MMINKSARYVSTLREKKLVKKFKDCVKESFEKLLTLLMKQEVCEIIV